MNASSIYTIILDDQPGSIKSLCQDLEKYPEIKIIEATTSINQAKKLILQYQPNLLFLDVEMPKQTGFDFLKEISPYVHPSMCVVFYSAFDKYMIEAIRASAFDYLLKPYQLDELNYIINRVKEKIKSGQVNFDRSGFRSANPDKKFAVQAVTGLLLLNQTEVLYFKYLNELRSWQLTLTNFTTHKMQQNTTSKDILNMNKSFIQVCRDHIINIDYLSSVENKTYRCLFYPPFNHLEIYASRRHYSQIKSQLNIL